MGIRDENFLTSLSLLFIEFYRIELSIPVVHLLNLLDYPRYITQKSSRCMEGSIDSYDRGDLSQTGITSCESWINSRSTRTGDVLICMCVICVCVCVCCKCWWCRRLWSYRPTITMTDYLSSHYCSYLRRHIIMVILRIALFPLHISRYIIRFTSRIFFFDIFTHCQITCLLL